MRKMCDLLFERDPLLEVGHRVQKRFVGLANCILGSTPRHLIVHPRQHDGKVDRFRHIVIGAGFQGFDNVLRLGLGGHHDDGETRGRECLAKPAQDLHAVHVRHHHVEKHDVECLLLNEPQRLRAAIGFDDLESAFHKSARKHCAVVRDVVDDQKPGCGELAFVRFGHWVDVAKLQFCATPRDLVIHPRKGDREVDRFRHDSRWRRFSWLR